MDDDEPGRVGTNLGTSPINDSSYRGCRTVTLPQQSPKIERPLSFDAMADLQTRLSHCEASAFAVTTFTTVFSILSNVLLSSRSWIGYTVNHMYFGKNSTQVNTHTNCPLLASTLAVATLCVVRGLLVNRGTHVPLNSLPQPLP